MSNLCVFSPVIEIGFPILGTLWLNVNLFQFRVTTKPQFIFKNLGGPSLHFWRLNKFQIFILIPDPPWLLCCTCLKSWNTTKFSDLPRKRCRPPHSCLRLKLGSKPLCKPLSRSLLHSTRTTCKSIFSASFRVLCFVRARFTWDIICESGYSNLIGVKNTQYTQETHSFSIIIHHITFKTYLR